MAIRLLVALIALGLLHVAPQLASWRRDGLFRRWVRQLSDTSGGGRVVLALVPPLVVCALLVWLFAHTLLGELPRLLFALVVLMYCFGPREFERDLASIMEATDGVGREAAAQALADDGGTVRWNAPALGEAIVYAALRRRFAVLLWFFLLGPVGALLYRLAQTLGRDDSLALDSDSERAAGY
ncbi:MAG: beta-lactamase induction protein, partial [Rhodanobacter sp.]